MDICKPRTEERTPVLPDDLDRYTKVSAAACQQQHADAIARMHRAAEMLDHHNQYAPGHSRLGIIGAGSMGTYLIILYAFSLGPVGYVVAVREFSVVVGAVLGFVFLKEKVTVRKIAAIALVVTGVVLIRLS